MWRAPGVADMGNVEGTASYFPPAHFWPSQLPTRVPPFARHGIAPATGSRPLRNCTRCGTAPAREPRRLRDRGMQAAQLVQEGQITAEFHGIVSGAGPPDGPERFIPV